MRTIIVLVGLLAVGCSGDESAAPLDCGNFESSFAAEDSMQQASSMFVAGEAISLHARITNNASSSQTLTSDTCPWQSVVVKNASDQVVWEYGAGTRNDPLMTCVPSKTYAAGETSHATIDWDQRDLDGSQVPVGNYTASFSDHTECGTELGKSFSFSIQ